MKVEGTVRLEERNRVYNRDRTRQLCVCEGESRLTGAQTMGSPLRSTAGAERRFHRPPLSNDITVDPVVASTA